MTNLNYLFVFLLIFILKNVICTTENNGTEDSDKLLAVVTCFRHGDRSPKRSFPTDKFFTAANFPMGRAHLTNKGINRVYELGQWFRKRYNTFLPQRYSAKDIYIRSTDVDRTLMSAAANLAGLYPPEGDQIWNEKIPWQPIPIHTCPRHEDPVIGMKKKCTLLAKLLEKDLRSKFYEDINENYSELYRYVSLHSGLNVTNITDIKLIRSVFYSYKNYNDSFIPPWAMQLNQTELDFLSALAYAKYTRTVKMKRLRSGLFLNYLITHFESVINNNAQKFLMLSSHDTSLTSVLDAMRVYDFHPVEYGGAVIWELRRNEKGKDYINMFYKRSETELFNLTLPGCTFDCSLEDFKHILKPVVLDQNTWEKECFQ